MGFEHFGRSMRISMLRNLEGTSLPCNPLDSLHFPPDLPPAYRADGYGGLRRLAEPHLATAPSAASLASTQHACTVRLSVRLSSLPHITHYHAFGDSNSPSFNATTLQAAIKSVTIRSSISRSPSYSPRFRRSWHLESTRHASGPTPSVCGNT